MKKILIIAERIGAEDTDKQDSKIVEIVRELSDMNEIHIYARSIALNEAGDYMRMKGVELHTQAVTLVVNMPKEYDVLISFDMWSMKQAGLFTSEKKIKVGEKTKLSDIFKEIRKK